MAETSESNRSIDEVFREYAWNYFALHAEQRLKTFQFYITLATAIVGAFFLLVRYEQAHKWIAILGLLLVILSFVFWKLDVRNRGLIKLGEEALTYLDGEHHLPDMQGAPHPLRIFARDDAITGALKPFPLSTGHFSYSRCFRYVFLTFALLGFSGGIACLILLPA